VIFERLLGRVTSIIPRFSATIVEQKYNGLLERYGLALADLFQAPERVRECLAAQALPQELQAAFDATSSNLGKSFSAIR